MSSFHVIKLHIDVFCLYEGQLTIEMYRLAMCGFKLEMYLFNILIPDGHLIQNVHVIIIGISYYSLIMYIYIYIWYI